jgi:hypothetical protein
LYHSKFELILPVFLGCLGSLFFSAHVVKHWPNPPQIHAEELPVPEVIAEEKPIVVESIHHFARKAPEPRDMMLELYREPEVRDRIVEFFEKICASREIAVAILANADTYNVAPALALALAWEESRLNPRAINSKNRDESVDRGLFQLNNRSFPRLETHSFFNPALNAKYGISHLRHCLDTGGTEVAALAMYNAGTVKVRSAGTPKTTLDYVSRILDTKKKIENRFHELAITFEKPIIEESSETMAEAKPERQRLVPLIPLASK